MECTEFRDIASSRVDGETDSASASALDAHLATCASCRAFVHHAHRLRRASLSEATGSPDLVAAVLQRTATLVRPQWTRARLGLAFVGIIEIVLAAQALLADSAHGHEVHRHIAFMYLALAAGFLAAAARPAQSASGVLPVTGVLLVCLFVSSGLDIAEGGVTAIAVLVHVVCSAGFAGSWLLARATSRETRVRLAL